MAKSRIGLGSGWFKAGSCQLHSLASGHFRVRVLSPSDQFKVSSIQLGLFLDEINMGKWVTLLRFTSFFSIVKEYQI